jgi:2,4-dienoyl-CoA reductase (NADPH2)
LVRLPWIFMSRELMGNDQARMLAYAQRLRELKVDYLHMVSGFGFPNPRDTPGKFPLDELKIFFNSTRHLSFKAATRATLLNSLPNSLARWFLNVGWRYQSGINLEFAQQFRKAVDLPVIVNGGFQERNRIEEALGADAIWFWRAR